MCDMRWCESVRQDRRGRRKEESSSQHQYCVHHFPLKKRSLVRQPCDWLTRSNPVLRLAGELSIGLGRAPFESSLSLPPTFNYARRKARTLVLQLDQLKREKEVEREANPPLPPLHLCRSPPPQQQRLPAAAPLTNLLDSPGLMGCRINIRFITADKFRIRCFFSLFEWSSYSPPIKANRIQFQAWWLPDFRPYGRCHWSASFLGRVGIKAVQCWDTEIGCAQPARSVYLIFSPWSIRPIIRQRGTVRLLDACKLCQSQGFARTIAGLALLATMLVSYQGESGSIPGRVIPGFLHVGIVPDDSGFPVYLSLSFRRCSILTAITLIASQDLVPIRTEPTAGDVCLCYCATRSLHVLLAFPCTRLRHVNYSPAALPEWAIEYLGTQNRLYCELQWHTPAKWRHYGQQYVGNTFSKRCLVTYSSGGSPANRKSFTAFSSQSHVRPVLKPLAQPIREWARPHQMTRDAILSL
ncbi:hypothetical protein PR048_000848 [Dryococelus australis]|uniref:Uncharacterized protein n=1 Tax=Dryococelus australis TaxID=614101 RepID=A0ABQ9IFS1_9NEOP|nr:hypothetical protein PR048_000848 [Dryococelus australis]